MKKVILILIVSLGLLANAQNESNINVQVKLKGEAQVYFELAHQPSSVQGQSRFDFGLLQLSPAIKIEDRIDFRFRFVMTEERSASRGNYLTEMQNAFLVYVDPHHPQFQHEMGLVRPLWHRQEGHFQQFEIFGPASWSLTRRYRMITEGDLGYQVQWMPGEKWSYSFAFVNGEENKQAEQGPDKNVLLQSFYHHADLKMQVALGYGRVDRLDSKVSDKIRALLSLEKALGRLSVRLEGLWAQDPSSDMEAAERLDGVTFTDVTGVQKIATTGGRFETSYNLTDKQALLLRYDYLKPEWNRKKLESFQAAWVQKESSHFSWGGFYEKTLYGAGHSSRSKISEFVRLGVGLQF